MYGSVFRWRVKPGMDERVMQLIEEFRADPPEGFVGAATYKLNAGGGEYITAAAHRDKSSYQEHAGREAQAAWFAKFQDCLDGDVEWNDGEVVAGSVG